MEEEAKNNIGRRKIIKIGKKTVQLFFALYQSYLKARVNKRNTINQLSFELNLEENLYLLAREISERRYKIMPSIAFVVTDPTRREIFAANFRDRVVHHLIFDYINPFWERKFIDDAYSCRVGKGTKFGIKRIARFMRAASDNYTQTAWILKLDIAGYFMHMNRERVWKNCLRQFREAPGKKADDELVKYLLHEVIFNDPTIDVRLKGNRHNWDELPRDKSLFYAADGYGFPIGNVTSQLFSNIYLHDLDCLVKYKLGFAYYGRYVDDFVIIDRDKNKLLQAVGRIREFLRKEMSLELHRRKFYLQPVKTGVAFVGGIIKPYTILPGRRMIKNYRRAIYANYQENKKEVWNSYVGHLQQFRSFKLLEVNNKNVNFWGFSCLFDEILI